MASKRHIRNRQNRANGCEGKLQLASKEHALQMLQGLRDKHPHDALTVYCCRICGLYHMGHVPGAEKLLRS